MGGSVGRAVDVAIVGGGMVGCAAAAFLADAGARVLLVEAAEIAGAASGRNSGVVQQPFDPPLAALYRQTVDLLRDLDGFVLPAEPAGLLYVSVDPAAANTLATTLQASHPEVEPEFVDGAVLRRLEPGLAPGVVACRLAIGYPVGPGRATRAFAEVAATLGAEIALGEPASLELAARGPDGGVAAGVRVGGILRPAGAVIVAAGPWTPQVVDPDGGWRPIRPLWGVVAEIDLPDPPRHVLEELEIDVTIEPQRPGEAAAAGASLVAFSLVTADGRSVVGSSFSDAAPDREALVPAILERARSFLPTAASAAVLNSRQCARPQSFDGRPLVGAVPGVERLFVAAGHGPWGISTGAASARLVADLVLRRVGAPPAALDPARYLGVAESR